MAMKNYYFILGVSPTASIQDIQDAFRALAKERHPDVAGGQGSADFREVLEAYQVLSDPERRRQYNQTLRVVPSSAVPQEQPIIIDHVDHGPPPEPLIPEPLSIRQDFQTIGLSAEALVERLQRNFTGLGIPKGERLESLSIEVLLSPEEAMRGGSVRIAVPVFYPCPACGGTGRDWLFGCLPCSEHGIIEEEAPVSIDIPAMVRDGTILEVPIRGLGIHNLYLRLHIRVT